MTGHSLRTPHADYAGRRVLVTGATGLIGAQLVHALLDLGAAIHAFIVPEPEPLSALVRSGDIARVTVHRGRLEQPAALQQAVERSRPEVVFHLAAQTQVRAARERPVETFATNISGTWTLLEACRGLMTPPLAIAVASSDKAYGASDHLPYVETDALAGEEPYEASKAATDIIARTYAVAYGLQTRIARCGNVYGIGDANWDRIVPGTIRAYLRGERPILRSDGTPVRDYVHVADVVDAYLALGQPGIRPGEPFNFSSGERRSVLEVVEGIRIAIGATLPPAVIGDARGELAEQYLDSSKALRLLGWSARRRMAEALPEMIDWYRGAVAATG